VSPPARAGFNLSSCLYFISAPMVRLNHEPLSTATPPSQREAEAETIRGRQRPDNVPGWQRADTGKQIGEGVGLV
jgi:hypothetical protein